MKRAALYIRVSTAEQTTQNQLLELRRYTERQGWEIAHIFDDSGLSGTRSDRPAFNAMMKEAIAGKFDLVVVTALDRLGRSTIAVLQTLQQLQAAGVEFCAVSQGIDTTSASGRMLASFLAIIAQWERETIVERVNSGIRRARANGVTLGRPRIAIDVRRAIQLRADGLGYLQIARTIGVPRTTLYRTLSAIPQTPAVAAG